MHGDWLVKLCPFRTSPQKVTCNAHREILSKADIPIVFLEFEDIDETLLLHLYGKILEGVNARINLALVDPKMLREHLHEFLERNPAFL